MVMCSILNNISSVGWKRSIFYSLFVFLKINNASIDDSMLASSESSDTYLHMRCIEGSSIDIDNRNINDSKGMKRKCDKEGSNDSASHNKALKPEKDIVPSNLVKSFGNIFPGYKYILNDASIYKDSKLREVDDKDLYFKLCVLTDDILRSDLNLGFSFDEMQDHYNKNIKTIQIPPEILDLINPSVFLFDGDEPVNLGIINSETRDSLDIDFTNKPILEKLIKSIKFIDVCQKVEEKGKFYLGGFEIKYGENYTSMKDVLTDEPIKNIENIYGIKFSKLKLQYNDIQLLNDEVKDNLSVRKLLSKFKYEINLGAEDHKKVEEWMSFCKIRIPDILIDSITYTQLNQNPIYAEKNLNRFINRSTLDKIPEKRYKRGKIKNTIFLLNKEIFSLVKDWRINFNTSQVPLFFNYIEKEILVFHEIPDPGLNSNEDSTNLNLIKKYIYLYFYHQHLKKIIDRLDNQKIFEFLSFRKKIRKDKKIESVKEYEKRCIEEKIQELLSYCRSKPNNEIKINTNLEEAASYTIWPKEKYQNIFIDLKSELEYEIAVFSELEESFKKRIKNLFPTAEKFDEEYNISWDKTLQIKEYKMQCKRFITSNIHKFVNEFGFETDSVDKMECLLKFDYELKRIFELKKRLEMVTLNLINKNTSIRMALKLKDYDSKIDQIKHDEYKRIVDEQFIKILKLKITFEDLFHKIQTSSNMKYGLYEEEITELHKHFEIKKEVEKEFEMVLKEIYNAPDNILESRYYYHLCHRKLNLQKFEFPDIIDIERNNAFLYELKQNFKKNMGHLGFIIDINFCYDVDKKNNSLIKIY